MNADFPHSRDEIIARIFEAGVVGAGGAGFPTHVKASARADVVIANGCECEPLLQTDRYVLESMAKTVVDGLLVMMLSTGATTGRIAVREGFPGMEETLKKSVEGARGMDVVTVADNYPAGDEHILVYETTGRVIPQGGIPPGRGRGGIQREHPCQCQAGDGRDACDIKVRLGMRRHPEALPV